VDWGCTAIGQGVTLKSVSTSHDPTFDFGIVADEIVGANKGDERDRPDALGATLNRPFSVIFSSETQ
jgi:hypothetical protein